MNKKRSYQKPEIKTVNLVPEEALITGCKSTMTGAGKQRCAESAGGCDNRLQGT